MKSVIVFQFESILSLQAEFSCFTTTKSKIVINEYNLTTVSKPQLNDVVIEPSLVKRLIKLVIV